MVVLNWMPNQRVAIFKWKSNGGHPFGNFETRSELMKRMTNRTKLQEICIAEVFNHIKETITWRYGDRVCTISCMGVTPGKDKISRGLPRCCGGEGVGAPHLENLRAAWKPTWGLNQLLEINECFLGDRFTRDGFKSYSEFELDPGSATRRTAAFFDDKGDLLTPFTEKQFFYPPITEEVAANAWKFVFRVVRKAEVREHLDPASAFLCGLDVDTKVQVDKVDLVLRRARIVSPVQGWLYLRDHRGKRILQEIKHVRDNEESYKF